MKNQILILLGASLLLSGCARFRKTKISPPATEIPVAAPVEEDTEEISEEIAEEVPANPLPDLASMSFVEKNTLYMQLLEEKSVAGADVSSAEALYQKSIEASLSGDSAGADNTLEEAIIYLWNL